MTIKELFGHAIGVAKFPDFAKLYNWFTKQDHTLKGDVTFEGGVDLADATVTGLSDSRPYKVYTALLTQGGTDAPTAVVLENTLGVTITWSRTSTGDYEAKASDDVFVENKTTVHGIITPAADAISFTAYWVDSTTLQVVAISGSGNIVEATTDAPSFFEIRVYN